jgi:Adenylate and Guanylate cyclase catalytic domain
LLRWYVTLRRITSSSPLASNTKQSAFEFIFSAACGVPEANVEHAVVMSRFARSIMLKFRRVCRMLELTLGPDTGGTFHSTERASKRNMSAALTNHSLRSIQDLTLRIGMHSGPVTAGVLRGQRARFQLFGDTVNTGKSFKLTVNETGKLVLWGCHSFLNVSHPASRIESTGKSERVHLSEQTALQLIQQGKEDWIVLREDAVQAKGKGKLVTYWLKLAVHATTAASVCSDMPENENDKSRDIDTWNVEMPAQQDNESYQRNDRLAHWNTELLIELLQRVVSRRAAIQGPEAGADSAMSNTLDKMAQSIGDGIMVVEEVVEVIDMPEFAGGSSVENVELSEDVVRQLSDYVTQIASMYKNNPCKSI